MRYVAAYLLAVLGGKSDPSAQDLKKILDSVGVEADSANLKIVIDNLKGKELEELIAEGMTKLATMPSGGGGGAPAAASGGDAGGAAEEKKEEKAPEPESDSDDDMGFDLFG